MLKTYHCPRCNYTLEREEGPGILHPARVLTCPTDRALLIPDTIQKKTFLEMELPPRKQLALRIHPLRENTWMFCGVQNCKHSVALNTNNDEAIRCAVCGDYYCEAHATTHCYTIAPNDTAPLCNECHRLTPEQQAKIRELRLDLEVS